MLSIRMPGSRFHRTTRDDWNRGRSQRKPNWGLLLFAVPFTCFALYIAYGFHSGNEDQQTASAAFKPVPARILSSQVETSLHSQPGPHSGMHVHQPRVVYEYETDGQTYPSRRFSYFGTAYDSDVEARLVVARYLVGSVQTAYFNPDNPAEAVLSRAMPSAWWKHYWFPALFVSVGLLALYGGWQGWLIRSGSER
ncbi:MAG: DUF3592 domain-containing protein [Pseudomonadota bacterium]|nr:DUF3592 domain-containing protein [Pseudomonadota bacterium]